MPKFKAYVKVPADSKGSLKRIVTKTISADNSVNALAQLRGQYGSSNVNIASQVTPGRRSFRPSSTSRTYVPKTTNYSRKNRTYKYAKPVPKSRDDAIGGSIGILFLFIITYLFIAFNWLTEKLLISFFGIEKVTHWYVYNKHRMALVTSSINLIMFFSLIYLLGSNQ